MLSLLCLITYKITLVLSFSNHISGELIDTCLTFNLSQMITQPTISTQKTSQILDLCLTTDTTLVENITYHPPISDHDVIHFNIVFETQRKSPYVKTIKDYNKANYSAINNELEIFFDSFQCDYMSSTVDENWILFRNKLAHLADTYIPSINITCEKSNPWFTKTLNQLNRKRKGYLAVPNN